MKHKCIGILGRRGSGKTTLLLDLLLTQWKNKFDLILIISPTIHLQKDIWDQIDGQGIVLSNVLDPIIINTLMDFMQKPENEDKNVLLVLDDMSSETRDKNKSEFIDRLAFTSRHFRITLVCLCQKFTLMSPSFRSQCDHLYLFHVSNTREISMIFQEFACVDNFEEFKEMMRDLDQFEVLCLDNIGGRIFPNKIDN